MPSFLCFKERTLENRSRQYARTNFDRFGTLATFRSTFKSLCDLESARSRMEATKISICVPQIYLKFACDGCQNKNCQTIRPTQIPQSSPDPRFQEQLCETVGFPRAPSALQVLKSVEGDKGQKMAKTEDGNSLSRFYASEKQADNRPMFRLDARFLHPGEKR